MLLTVALMLFTFSARAGSITEEQARAKAWNFLQTRHPSPVGKRLAAARTPNLRATTGPTNPGTPSPLYVFNVGENDGFVIVAGDDRVRSILGYADSGSFDADLVPAALNEMLAIYARQIDMAVNSGLTAPTAWAQHRVSGTVADVAPLLSTIWDQGDPYNAYCPTLNDQTALTGCVATAMAQIANYYKYPTGQVPSLAAYTSATNKINVSAWGATTFDWDNMLPSYSGSYTNAQKTAVATLMRYCGQAAQMDYGFTSGAYNGDALYAFKEKLGYNANADFRSAADYGTDGWEDIIYNEVSAGRPVYYSALNGDVGCDVDGHAFVIDGYRADGNYFHVNWGWGGACNGYFNLFALDANAPESAPTETGWHYQMLAIIGLTPNTGALIQDANGNWLISSTDDWNELSTNLEAYNGGSFKLTKNISVTTMVGTEWMPFSGTFDGQGHVLNVNIESNGWGAAPFNFVTEGTTIKNLKTQGSVTCSVLHASGLIGGPANDDEFPLAIINCEVAVQVNGSIHAGGFIGHAMNMNPTFTDCIFSGSINGCNYHGCFVGWKEWDSYPVYVNCLSIPTYIEGESSYDFSHPGMGEENQATLTNCYFNNAAGFNFPQGTEATPAQLANGFVAHALQHGSRQWTTNQVWGQQIGTDAMPVLTNDASKMVYKVSFSLYGQVVKTVFTNGTLGDTMPTAEEFGLTNAVFTYNGSPFTGTTPISNDITVIVTGTATYTLTLNSPAHGTITVNNNVCIPGTLKKITAFPSSGYVVSTIKVTDTNNKALPITQVSNNASEYVFVFPKSSVTVTAQFTAEAAEDTRFINGGLTLPMGNDQPWTADTWTIWSNEYQPTLGTPPADALGHQWYEENYMLTNSDDDMQPNGRPIVWENHTAPFGRDRNYDYNKACGGDGGPTNFYFRRIFTFNTETVPEKLFLTCNFDDAPVQVFINGTLVYNDQRQNADSYCKELTPAQMALIHTDGTPNVLAARGSQGGGDYYLDCGLYDPTALSYEVTSQNTVRVLPNHFFTGDIVIPETVTYNGVTYTVTELPDEVTNDCPYMTSMSIPRTITSLGTEVFGNDNSLQYVKSYIPIYQIYSENVLIAAPLEATEFEVAEGCQRIWNNAFKFTDKLQTLTLPRSLAEICEKVFVGCTALKDIYSHALPVPQTEGNAFEGIDKSKITVHVYASALDSYKESWGEEFQYVTMPDPQPVTLTINVAESGTLRSLIENAAAQTSSTIYDVVGITVTGTINQDDLSTLSQMCTGIYRLAAIDLSGASIDDNYIGYGRFRDREKLTSIILPETLEYIDESAFDGCIGLTAIHIPASVVRMHSYVFDNCPSLVTVTGCEGLTDPYAWEDWYVFGWKPNIEGDVYGGTTFLSLDKDATGEYEVPAGIKVIVGGAMHERNITSVIIPASVTDLGNDVFRGCHQLKDFFVYAATPPVCHEGSMEYDYDKSQATLHVPAAAVEDYQNAEEWCEFGQIVAMASYELTVNVTTPGTFATALAAAMTDANITTVQAISKLTVTGTLNDADKEELATIGTENAFIDIRSAYTITSGSQLIAVATSATSLEFDNSLSTIHRFAFAGCSLLTDIIFTNNLIVPSLPANAFGDEDKTKVTLHVYESYLERFQRVWGDEFTYVTMADPDNLVLLFTGEPLYLYNVDAGLYFCAGNSYGTQASLSADPMEVTLEAAPGDSYIIKTLGGSDELFMEGNTCYVDRSGRNFDYYWEFLPQNDGTFLIRMAASNTLGATPQNYPDKYFGRNDLGGTWLTHMVDINDANAQIRWQIVYLNEIQNIELAEADYAALCAISETLGGDEWTKKWDTTTRKVSKNAWSGVAVNDDGHVTAINLDSNNLSGDISTLTLYGLTALKSLNLSNNALTGNIEPLVASLPAGCKLNVEGQDLGHVGEFTLYELCRYGGLPSIAYWQSENATLAQTLIGVNGVCQFYHEGTNGGHYWDCYIYSDGNTTNNFKFYWPSPVTVTCLQPHRFTFTYRYDMGDANMDDKLDLLDLQTTLNYSNGQQWGLFNHYAADTYGPDDDINVQDIVSTVNILLAQEESAGARSLQIVNRQSTEACVSVENGELVLYTTQPVAALDLRLTGIQPGSIHWNVEALGFSTASTSQACGTHAIVYSLQPRELDEGRTVLATFDAHLAPCLTAAVLSNSKAQPISVGCNVPTGINDNNRETITNNHYFDLQGRSVMHPQKGLYIENGKKVVIK